MSKVGFGDSNRKVGKAASGCIVDAESTGFAGVSLSDLFWDRQQNQSREILSHVYTGVRPRSTLAVPSGIDDGCPAWLPTMYMLRIAVRKPARQVLPVDALV